MSPFFFFLGGGEGSDNTAMTIRASTPRIFLIENSIQFCYIRPMATTREGLIGNLKMSPLTSILDFWIKTS